MKLYDAGTSPFARKVRIVIAEKQLTGIDLVTVSPFDLPPALVAINPLSKVPARQIDEGNVLDDTCDIP
ncbi:MAG: glutathione S-transferase N-terminal domain-containing protein [Chakrabartia sp.]